MPAGRRPARSRTAASASTTARGRHAGSGRSTYRQPGTYGTRTTRPTRPASSRSRARAAPGTGHPSTTTTSTPTPTPAAAAAATSPTARPVADTVHRHISATGHPPGFTSRRQSRARPRSTAGANSHASVLTPAPPCEEAQHRRGGRVAADGVVRDAARRGHRSHPVGAGSGHRPQPPRGRSPCVPPTPPRATRPTPGSVVAGRSAVAGAPRPGRGASRRCASGVGRRGSRSPRRAGVDRRPTLLSVRMGTVRVQR